MRASCAGNCRSKVCKASRKGNKPS
jgi:hypothetical protein